MFSFINFILLFILFIIRFKSSKLFTVGALGSYSIKTGPKEIRSDKITTCNCNQPSLTLTLYSSYFHKLVLMVLNYYIILITFVV